MTKKKSLILCIIAVILLICGIVSTTSAVKAGKEYKEGMAAYNIFADAGDTLLGQYGEKQGAHAYSQTKSAEIARNKLYTNMIVSMVLYLGVLVIAFYIYRKMPEPTESDENK